MKASGLPRVGLWIDFKTLCMLADLDKQSTDVEYK